MLPLKSVPAFLGEGHGAPLAIATDKSGEPLLALLAHKMSETDYADSAHDGSQLMTILRRGHRTEFELTYADLASALPCSAAGRPSGAINRVLAHGGFLGGG
jgi:hypothetical protein